MKTIYLIYAILFKDVSVIRIDDNLDGKNIKYAAHDKAQDGYGGTNGAKWSFAGNPQDAVWKVFHDFNLI